MSHPWHNLFPGRGIPAATWFGAEHMRLMPVVFVEALVLVACVHTQATLVNPAAPAYAPVPEDSVRILTSETELDSLDYVRVAIIEATGSGEFTSQTGMLEAMRKKAGSLGANAILLPAIQEPGAGAKVAAAVLGTGTQRKGNVIAIRILGPRPEPRLRDGLNKRERP